MNAVAVDLTEIRRKVEELRKSAHVPYWRMAFADFLLDRIADYNAAFMETEASETLRRLDRWVESHSRHVAALLPPVVPEFTVWTAPLLLKSIQTVRSTLVEKKALIPAAERDSYSRRLDRIETWIGEGKYRKAHNEILSVRSGLIGRLQRSYRARVSVMQHASRRSASPLPTQASVGLYNTQHTLEGAFGLVGERDPIWVEDFLELYDNLAKVADRLAPVEKKKGRLKHPRAGTEN